MRRAWMLAVFFAVALPEVAAASPPCGLHLPQGRGPTFDNPGYAASSTTLCFQGFTTVYSGLTRTPLWSAEMLTPERIAAARQQTRDDAFHVELGLPEAWRAQLSDYVRSGYDRGHLAPSGDMADPDSQRESFSLANIIPQAPRLNRGEWERLESAVRQRAALGTLYVITGVRFEGAQIAFLKGNVGVPPKIYKLVYDPAARAASVFVADNADGAPVISQDVAAFEQEAGIRFRLGPVDRLTLDPAPRRNH